MKPLNVIRRCLTMSLIGSCLILAGCQSSPVTTQAICKVIGSKGTFTKSQLATLARRQKVREANINDFWDKNCAAKV